MKDESRAGLIVGLMIGVPMMLVGVVGIAQHSDATPPSSFLKFFIGGDIAHDAIVAPVAVLVGLAMARFAPSRARAPLRAALFGSAIVFAIAWPAVRGYGRMRAPDNISVQPLNYATALATVISGIWVIAVVWLLTSLLTGRRRRSLRATSPDATAPDGS